MADREGLSSLLCGITLCFMSLLRCGITLRFIEPSEWVLTLPTEYFVLMKKFSDINKDIVKYGGQGGIRTLGTLSSTHP